MQWLGSTYWSLLPSPSLHGCSYQSQEIPPLWPWVWLMSCYYLFNMKWMELCDVSPSVLTVWNIQRWLMGVCLSSDGPDHRLYWRYDIIRLLGVMSSHLQGQEELLFPASLGEFLGNWSLLGCVITACAAENTNFELVTRISTICFLCSTRCKSSNSTSIMEESLCGWAYLTILKEE